jgi:rhodanese-related sulfurtransferase
MSTISMKDLKEKLGHLAQDELILDVRSPEEFALGHVPGSRNIPHGNVGRFADELRKYRNVYVHCQAGGRAMIAFQELKRLGLDNLVCIASGGMGDWVAAGFPIER